MFTTSGAGLRGGGRWPCKSEARKGEGEGEDNVFKEIKESAQESGVVWGSGLENFRHKGVKIQIMKRGGKVCDISFLFLSFFITFF